MIYPDTSTAAFTWAGAAPGAYPDAGSAAFTWELGVGTGVLEISGTASVSFVGNPLSRATVQFAGGSAFVPQTDTRTVTFPCAGVATFEYPDRAVQFAGGAHAAFGGDAVVQGVLHAAGVSGAGFIGAPVASGVLDCAGVAAAAYVAAYSSTALVRLQGKSTTRFVASFTRIGVFDVRCGSQFTAWTRRPVSGVMRAHARARCNFVSGAWPWGYSSTGLSPWGQTRPVLNSTCQPMSAPVLVCK